jgi:hypothetical protein
MSHGVHTTPADTLRNPLIIERMLKKREGREQRMTLRLTAEEAALRDLLAEHLGINHAGVMRQGMLELARAKGITLPRKKEKPGA